MTDQEILFIDINSSRTRTEYPIIADVDGDFKAEIIASTNNESGQGDIGDAGVEVFEDRLDNWVGTLPIWNQHTYHVTNVLADGSIPDTESPNWGPHLRVIPTTAIAETARASWIRSALPIWCRAI